NGSIDFMCFPEFDSPSIFASMLDKDNGGFFQIVPVNGETKNKQLYLPDTNVLLTRFRSEEGVGEVTDFMPGEEVYEGHVLMRRLTNVRGKAIYKMKCFPKFDYGRSDHEILQIDAYNILFKSRKEGGITLKLKSTVEITQSNSGAEAKFCLMPGET